MSKDLDDFTVVKDKKHFEELSTKFKKKLVVLDFFAYWCGYVVYILNLPVSSPCIQIEDDEKIMAKRLREKNVEFIRVDCDNTDTNFLMQSYKVLCAPTFCVTKNKVKLGVVIGAKLDRLQTIIDKKLPVE